MYDTVPELLSEKSPRLCRVDMAASGRGDCCAVVRQVENSSCGGSDATVATFKPVKLNGSSLSRCSQLDAALCPLRCSVRIGGIKKTGRSQLEKPDRVFCKQFLPYITRTAHWHIDSRKTHTLVAPLTDWHNTRRQSHKPRDLARASTKITA